MKTILIRIYFKNALLIALAILVLAGVTGLSYKAHYCHDKLSGIAFYPELGFQQSISCSCTADDNPVKSHSNSDSPVLHKNSCCSYISFFSKLTIESSPSDIKSNVQVQMVAVLPITIYCETSITGNGNIQISDFHPRPVTLSGRKLVLFLSQQRIPLISYIC